MKKSEEIKTELLTAKLNNKHEHSVVSFGNMQVEFNLKLVAYINRLLFDHYENIGLTPHPDLVLDEEVTSFFMPVYMNRVKERIKKDLYPQHVNVGQLCMHLSEIQNIFSRVLGEFGNFFSMDVSLIDVMDKIEEYEEVDDIINKDHFNETDTAQDILKTRSDLYERIRKYKIEPFYTLGKVGEGIRTESTINVLIGIGLRPDVANPNRLNNFVIHSNWLNGTRNLRTDAEEVNIALRALGVQKTSIKDTGVLNKRTKILASDQYIRMDVDSCDSVNKIEVAIPDEATLKKYLHRYYVDPITGVEKVLSSSDTHLIGQLVKFRSPATCNLETGICKKCFTQHNLDYVNNTSFRNVKIGGIAVELTISAAGQLILQAKHNTKPNPQQLLGTVEDLRFGNITQIGDEDCPVGLAFNKIKLMDPEDNISKVYMKNTRTRIGKYKTFQELVIDTKLGGYDVLLESSSDSYVGGEFKYEDVISLSEDSPDLIELEDLSKLTVNLPNYPLTHLFNSLEAILKMKGVDKKHITLDQLIAKMNSILPDVDPILSEVLIANLIRSNDDKFTKPDWSKPDVNYQLLALNSAIINFPELTPGLSIGYVINKMTNHKYYEQMPETPSDVVFALNNE